MKDSNTVTRHGVHPGIFLFQLVVFLPFTVILVAMEMVPMIVDVLTGTRSVQSLDWSLIGVGVLMGVIPIAIATYRFVSSACVIDADALGIRCKRLFSRQQVRWADVLMVSIGGCRLKIASATAELSIPLEYVTRPKGLTDFVTQHVDPLSLVNDGSPSSIEEEQAQR